MIVPGNGNRMIVPGIGEPYAPDDRAGEMNRMIVPGIMNPYTPDDFAGEIGFLPR